MAHTVVFGVCFSQGCSCLLRWPTLCVWSAFLSKPTSYLSLCLSLNSSRTWAPLGSEMKCVISVVGRWVLAGFKSQAVPNLRWTVSVLGGLSSCGIQRLCQRVIYIPWEGAQTLFYCQTIGSWLLFLSPFLLPFPLRSLIRHHQQQAL